MKRNGAETVGIHYTKQKEVHRMCQNIFKSEEESKRREDFTKLFVLMVTSVTSGYAADKVVLKQTERK